MICDVFFAATIVFGLLIAPFEGNADDKQVTQKQFNASSMADIKQAIEYLNSQRTSRPEDPNIRGELARAYSYYAIQLSSSDMSSAIDYMQRASDLEPNNAEYSRNLGMLHLKVGYAYYSSREIARALPELKEAVRCDPGNIDALVILGDLSYSDNKLEEALDYWSRALAVDPKDGSISSKIGHVRGEIDKQRTFKKRETQNFIFTFDESLNEFRFGNMETLLNEVYVKIGQDFNYFPNYRITVQVYPLERYRREVDASDNVIGVYDGRIKLPEYSSMREADYRRVVYHEYMHAMVYDISGGGAPRWLHEGLATYADPGFKANADFLSDLYKRNKLANCRDLEGYFTGSGGRDTLNIAYNQANSIVNYFLSRYNFWHMKNILTDLKTGMKIDDAFKKEISVDTTDLFLQWEESNFKK